MPRKMKGRKGYAKTVMSAASKRVAKSVKSTAGRVKTVVSKARSY